LLAAADAELALHMPVFMYFGNRKEELVDLLAAFKVLALWEYILGIGGKDLTY